jgi:hypothetical protein
MLAPFGRGVLFQKPFHNRFTFECDSPLANPYTRYLTFRNQLIDFPS